MSTVTAIGIDVGSTTWKAVAIDANQAIVASVLEPTHPLIEEQTRRCLSLLRERAGVTTTVPIGATGYGRKRVKADRVVTEITCHAAGAFARMGRPGMLIDIGGQDSKVIRIGERGAVLDFSMNDKCAAGTGRFLEVILARLQVPLDEVGGLVAGAARSVAVSSTCTVFAESEVVSLVAQGEPLAGIVKGLLAALASRVTALAGRPGKEAPIFLSGGVARNGAMVQALADSLGQRPQVVPDPQLVGALGAALSVNKMA